MKKTLFLICVLLSNLSVYAQTIAEIKSSAQQIEGKMSNEKYEQDNDQFREIKNILNLNVFGYYNIGEEYNTELKRKVYKNSEEYKGKLSELQDKKKELKNTLYYLDFEPAYYERNNLIKYNLSSKYFAVTNQVYADEFYNKPSCVQFDQIVFKCPNGTTVDRSLIRPTSVEFIEQRFKFKIVDEALALRIEEDRSKLKLLFVFKFTEAVPYLGLDVFGRETTMYALLNTPVKVMAYNSETDEVYYTYNRFDIPKVVPKTVPKKKK